LKSVRDHAAGKGLRRRTAAALYLLVPRRRSQGGTMTRQRPVRDVLGGPDRAAHEDVLGGPDRAAHEDVLGGPDPAAHEDVLGGPGPAAHEDVLGGPYG